MMYKITFILLFSTSLIFSQDTTIHIDSLTKEKTISFDTEGSNLGGRYEIFYANGVLKEKGQILNEFGCLMKSGKFEYFNELGILTKTEYYKNWLENEGDGCHSTIHDITVNEYYKNGCVKAEKFYQSAFEAGENYNVGIWSFYNNNGYLLKHEIYPWFFNHKYGPDALKNEENKLVSLFDKLKNSNPELRFDSVAPAFEKNLLITLNTKDNWHYPLTKLSKQIKILSSKDSLIRTFSWDEMSGGSRHDMKSYIQYKRNDTIKIINLRDNEKENGYRNAAIDEIIAFNNGYFIVGWGTFGSGAMHLIITYYKFDNGVLKPCPIFEKNKSEYGIEISRGDKFNLKIDPVLKQITFNETLYNEELGYYYQTGRLTKLAFIDHLKIFVKKEEK